MSPNFSSVRETPPSVVLVDDSTLFRQGLARLLSAAGVTVSAELSTPAALDAVIRQTHTDVVILDVRMPPTHTDEGLNAAITLRRKHPTIGALVLSTYTESTWAARLIGEASPAIGYLLKDRVGDVTALVDAIQRIRRGETVLDPDVVKPLMARNRAYGELSSLTSREREVLSLMAQGFSTIGISRHLQLSQKTVETHVAAIFMKLPLSTEDNTYNRRVLAVLAFLRQSTQ